MTSDLSQVEAPFQERHIGPSVKEVEEMLSAIGASSLQELIDQTVPNSIRNKGQLDIPPALTEHDFLKSFKKLMSKNKVFKSYIGQGYYGCITPKVILRNILENPGWYTAYTPYQAEIAQGRLEALINFQTVVSDLTGLEVANASLLDEGTAAAEAMIMFYNRRKGEKKNAQTFLVDKEIFPQTLSVLKTRSAPLGINIELAPIQEADLSDPDIFGALIQYPNNSGEVVDHSGMVSEANEKGVKVAMIADLLSLVLLKSPGSMGADAAIGTTQRFGVPMGFGGPHAAYFATKAEYKRQIPGRIIGVSKDRMGHNAYRMALQTREQHIRREKATSNICTAQVLLAIMASMYAVYHGEKGLIRIAKRLNSVTTLLAKELSSMGYVQRNQVFFDTLRIEIENVAGFKALAEKEQINFRYFEDSSIGVSLDETTTLSDIEDMLRIFALHKGRDVVDLSWMHDPNRLQMSIPSQLRRDTRFLQHPVFAQYHTEHEMLRYIKRLESKDLSLVHSMISLGSCTMKLNATSEMIPLSWTAVANLHPFVPEDQCQGYMAMFDTLNQWLAEITGLDAVSLQPNSGAQGEYAGLMVIRAFHHSRGDDHRNVCLIPASAHGTNPASAVMAGQSVVIVKCDENGNIDIEDLTKKAEEHGDHLSSLMITYPSTHGVFEENIAEICRIVHDHGGQVYMDGANMNAQVGLTSPGAIGADVCHLNLHKTFCIPHGGGGPGMGPICVASHLSPFLPGNPNSSADNDNIVAAISAAPYGSSSILTISYAYIAMMGGEGLTRATEVAILSANYMMKRLAEDYKVLYLGEKGRCAHEFIIDCRMFKSWKVDVIDIAKRLMDYGYHAPTVSFPVPGTMMIEPTESETKLELDRFCDAMLNIRKEIAAIENEGLDTSNNLIVNAPHTIEMISTDDWTLPYSRQSAAFPLEYIKTRKFWPSVARVDDAYGDRNLMCVCPPIETYTEEEQLEITQEA